MEAEGQRWSGSVPGGKEKGGPPYSDLAMNILAGFWKGSIGLLAVVCVSSMGEGCDDDAKQSRGEEGAAANAFVVCCWQWPGSWRLGCMKPGLAAANWLRLRELVC